MASEKEVQDLVGELFDFLDKHTVSVSIVALIVCLEATIIALQRRVDRPADEVTSDALVSLEKTKKLLLSLGLMEKK